VKGEPDQTGDWFLFMLAIELIVVFGAMFLSPPEIIVSMGLFSGGLHP